MISEVPLSKRRGFQFTELEANRIGILLVKAPIELTSPVIAQVFGGHLELNIWGKQYHPSDCWMRLVYQYQGHRWSILFLDFLLRKQDAWLPNYEYIPWGETIKAESANADDFVRVDGIAITTKIERQTPINWDI